MSEEFVEQVGEDARTRCCFNGGWGCSLISGHIGVVVRT